MALTKISTGGVKDDAASQAKIADEAVDEARLQVSNTGTNGQFLQKQSGSTGGLTWATATTDTSDKAPINNPTFTGTVTTPTITVDNGTSSKLSINSSTHSASTANEAKLELGFAHSGNPDAIGYVKLNEIANNIFDGKLTVGVPYNGGSGGSATRDALFINQNGAIGVTGESYGSSGQVLTSGGSGAAPSWATVSGGLSSDSQSNTIAGTNAGANLTSTAYTNSLFGYNAGNDLTTGDQNVYIGADCGCKATTASYNTAVGHEAGPALGGNVGTGNYNTCIGYYAGKKLTSGYENVIVGGGAMFATTTGYYNTAVGDGAGAALTTGYNNLLLGLDSGRYAGSPSGQITTQSNIICLGNNSITDLYCNDTSISSSDKRDKTDVTDFTHGLKWINQLKPVTYRWDKRTWYTEYNDDGSVKSTATPDGSKKRARQHIGFLAQDVLEIEKADGYASKKDDMLVVNLNEDDTAYGLKYERLVPVLVNAIKELSAKVETLETKVAALESA